MSHFIMGFIVGLLVGTIVVLGTLSLCSMNQIEDDEGDGNNL